MGIDGCPAGWIAASFTADRKIVVEVLPSAQSIADRYVDGLLAVDMPVGLSDAGPRTSDTLARRMLGTRGVCVFPSPIRPALYEDSHPRASAVQCEIDGRRIGVQSWAIVPKIREWDQALRADAALAGRTFEAHPEVSFTAMNDGRTPQQRKARSAGKAIRREILLRVFGSEVVVGAEAQRNRAQAGMDDLYDALAALWSALRIRDGAASSLPAPPEVDSVGLQRAIWY